MTNEERLVLSHIVVDPDAWYTHAINTFGVVAAREMLIAKVNKWRPVYLSVVREEGYKNRVERDLEEESKIRKINEEELLIQAKIREIAIASLQSEGKISIKKEE